MNVIPCCCCSPVPWGDLFTDDFSVNTSYTGGSSPGDGPFEPKCYFASGGTWTVTGGTLRHAFFSPILWREYAAASSLANLTLDASIKATVLSGSRFHVWHANGLNATHIRWEANSGPVWDLYWPGGSQLGATAAANNDIIKILITDVSAGGEVYDIDFHKNGSSIYMATSVTLTSWFTVKCAAGPLGLIGAQFDDFSLQGSN